MSSPTTKQAVLITGASTGIGYELAEVFARQRHPLILVSRDAGRLEGAAASLRTHGVAVTSIPMDLALPGAAVALHEAARPHGIGILVNNAGYGVHGFFLETSWEEEARMMQLNMVTLVHLTKLFVRERLPHRSGRVLNVASTAAFQAGPLMALYYATKAFVLSFSEAIANELKGTGLSVSALCPGPTKTEFQARSGAGATRALKGKFIPVASAREVAMAGYRGLMRGQRLIVPGAFNKLTVQANRLLPRAAVQAVLRVMQERARASQP